MTTKAYIKNSNSSGELDAWFIHIAEGVDERSRAEFDILVQNDLLVGNWSFHGVALGQREFTQMAAVRCSFVAAVQLLFTVKPLTSPLQKPLKFTSRCS